MILSIAAKSKSVIGSEAVDRGRGSYATCIVSCIGYLKRIASRCWLEKETQRNIEMMWLIGRLMPDFKTIATCRKESTKALRGVWREFVALCRDLNLFSDALAASDSSKFPRFTFGP